ncbi:hypothetical protein IB256_25670 [Pseudomonas sp. PDM17]|uniref:hypothetical protein n=1 Tax=Pseudomonas sp. PDM17 TaxID=2769285 RepID=UPI00177E3C78|nr:hypothetical protein [Pseudomonas sp. PDM17]MBD9504196.1 hypothetical protein [Pseudomonas sp. PDM17]
MVRLLAAVMLILFPSLLWSAEYCSGQYSNTREMVEAALRKYDTLYSGGDHWHGIDDVGATLDLYRLWRDLPDWHLRELQLGWQYVLPPEDEPVLSEQHQWIAEQVDGSPLQPEQKFDAIVGLDLAGRISKPVDSWLSDADSYSPQWTWLQLVMNASDAPWAIVPHLMQAGDPRLPAFARLKDLAWKRYEKTGGIAWAVAAQALLPIGETDAKAAGLFQLWQSRVERCSASQSEYAAWAVTAPTRWVASRMGAEQISDLSLLFQQLPVSAQRMVIRNWSWATLLASFDPPTWPDDSAARLEAIAGVARLSPVDLSPWVNVARTYLASTLEELITIHRDNKVEAKSARAFNLLSAANLARLAETPALTPEMRKALVMTAFARHVALGNVEQAMHLLPLLQQVAPEQAPAIDLRLGQALPQQIRLELIALDNPQMSTWLVTADVNEDDVAIEQRNSRPRRDLPRELAYSMAIEQDLQAWLLLPQKWDRFLGMHGYVLGALDRNYASTSRTKPAAVVPPVLFRMSPDSPDDHLGRLVAWDEMPRLVEGNGLSHTISRDIVEWVDSESDSWLKRLLIDQELMAQALGQVVRLNRGEAGGMLGQQPSGQVAFQLLHRRFPNSEAAKRTPYWYR